MTINASETDSVIGKLVVEKHDWPIFQRNSGIGYVRMMGVGGEGTVGVADLASKKGYNMFCPSSASQ